jgi:alpha-D-xyloside xylohydrolase
MDATEPDLEQPMPTLAGQRELANPTGLGTGARVLNGYALANSKAIYEGQRAAAPDQRVFILTRSGFAGQQRYGAAVWSGDITATWTALKKQIPAGLSLALSGLPYWTTDIGGFAVPPRWAGETMTPEDQEEWRELNTRWFQYGTFCPLFRAHGQFPFREMWNVASESHPAYQTQLKFDRLRYRLLPYIYSLGGAVTHRSATIMRPLIMDFPWDPNVREIGDQFMFGPALLVNPVTDYQARSRSVYLPRLQGWFDFWTGAALRAGQRMEASAPYDSLPLFVAAGSIIPTGPELQYTGEKPADPITLLVYAGADGAFSLYEDDGLTYGYERGQATRIPLRWDDKTKTLTIEKREGSFPGMLAERTFNVVLIAPEKPVGFSFDLQPDQTVRYTGKAVKVRLTK